MRAEYYKLLYSLATRAEKWRYLLDVTSFENFTAVNIWSYLEIRWIRFNGTEERKHDCDKQYRQRENENCGVQSDGR